MTLIDKINKTMPLVREGKISIGAMGLYYVLLITWNRLGRKEFFRLTDHQIMAMTQIKKEDTVRKYRKELLSLGLIGFTSSKKLYGSEYEVC